MTYSSGHAGFQLLLETSTHRRTLGVGSPARKKICQGNVAGTAGLLWERRLHAELGKMR